MRLIKNLTKAERNTEILKLYRNGKMTLAVIADIFGFTKSRAQQIIINEIKKEIKNDFKSQCLSGVEKCEINKAAKDKMKNIVIENRQSSSTEKEKNIIERISLKMKTAASPSSFCALSNYAKTLGEKTEYIKKYFPEIANLIVVRKKHKWSRYYNKCRVCGTTSFKHISYGLCKRCYFKSDIFKELQEASRVRNQYKWKQRQSEYAKEYKKRVEVKEKNRKTNDINNFGGNRERALMRDGYKCQECGLTQADSQIKFKKDLFVKHLSNNHDHSLENLITLCMGCFRKRAIKLMHDAYKNKIKKHTL